MSTPQFPDEPSYWLRRLFESVDGIDKKLDVHAEKLATQEVRIQAVEMEVSALRDAAKDSAVRTAEAKNLADRVTTLETASDKNTAIRRANIMFVVTTLVALLSAAASYFSF